MFCLHRFVQGSAFLHDGGDLIIGNGQCKADLFMDLVAEQFVVGLDGSEDDVVLLAVVGHCIKVPKSLHHLYEGRSRGSKDR